jgi:hypothetical protein
MQSGVGHGKNGAAIVYQHLPTNMVKNGMKEAINDQGNPTGRYPAMPCFGDPAAPEKFVTTVMAAINGQITAADYDQHRNLPTRKAVGFSPPDHPIECACPECRKL